MPGLLACDGHGRWLPITVWLSTPGRAAPVGGERRTHLALAVPDFDAFVQRLAVENIPFSDFTGQPATVQNVRDDRVRQIFIRDPDGYWIEVNDAVVRRG